MRLSSSLTRIIEPYVLHLHLRVQGNVEHALSAFPDDLLYLDPVFTYPKEHRAHPVLSLNPPHNIFLFPTSTYSRSDVFSIIGEYDLILANILIRRGRTTPP